MTEVFQIHVDDAVLNDLHKRLQSTRFSSAKQPSDWSEGTPAVYLHELISYWVNTFDWRRQEAMLNQFEHHRADVDGTKIHFIHERAKGPSPFPILLTHGYPDSFFRFYKLIPMLTDPAAYGGEAEDAFDVVVPSLPGYGFSEARKDHGGFFGFGDVLNKLMTNVLAYERYAAHGGDWGSNVTEHLARSHGGAVAGIHLTDVPFWHAFQKPDDLSHAEKKFLAASEARQKDAGAYSLIQGTRPASLAVGMLDSPAGLAAWLLEKFQEWSDCNGDIETSFSKDELLTNIMIYWATQTIETSFQTYRDVAAAGPARWMGEVAKGWVGSHKTPAAFAMFPKDITSPPKEWAERFFNVERWTEMPRGGHFAALEEPELLAEDIRTFFRSHRH